jgi:hypothetical protein
MKTYLNKKSFNRSGSTKSKASEYSNLQTAFEHLEKIQAIALTKKGSLVQSLVKTEPLISFYKNFKKNEEAFEEFQQNFSTLFSLWQTIENEDVAKSSRPGKGRKATVTNHSKIIYFNKFSLMRESPSRKRHELYTKRKVMKKNSIEYFDYVKIVI